MTDDQSTDLSATEEAARIDELELLGDDRTEAEEIELATLATNQANREEAPDFWALLETPPPGCEAVADLWHWSTNYDAGKGPASLFLDLIGWSADNLGQSIYQLGDASGLGYVELGKLAAALTEYADRPHDVRQFVETLLDAEGSR